MTENTITLIVCFVLYLVLSGYCWYCMRRQAKREKEENYRRAEAIGRRYALLERIENFRTAHP